jgi:hypothetical protein
MDRTIELRKLALNRLVRMLAVVGAVAYIPSLYACIMTRMWLVAAADSLSFALFIFASVSRRFGYRAKLILAIGGSLAIAGFVLFSTGSEGAGYIWLICSILIATLLGKRPAVVSTIAGSGIILGGYIVIVALGLSPFGDNLLTVLVIAANLVLICALAAILAKTLIEGLEEANAEEKRLARRLSEELESTKAADGALHAEMEAKEQLLRELNHRVRNNLQVVQSLLDIESLHGDEGALVRMSRRVRVLALANDLILSDPEAPTVDLRGLVTATLSIYRWPDGESLFSIGSFSMGIGLDRITGFAIALAEIGETVGSLGAAVAVGLEGPEGAKELTFRWKAESIDAAGTLVERLRADYILGSLSLPGALSFGPGGTDKEASLSIRVSGL